MDNMQLWLTSSTDSINLNGKDEGYFLNPELDGLTGLPEIRSVNGLNAGYDGGWTATQLWAARLITIRGVIADSDVSALESKRKALAKIMSQGKNEDLELKFVSEAGNVYTVSARTTYCTMALQRVFARQEYQIQLRANDPLIYDDGGSELMAVLRVMAGLGGFEIPFEIPFTIGGSIEPTAVDVGDEATYPLIRLKGDLHNPTIVNMTTNQQMQVLADIISTFEWREYTTAQTIDGYTQIGNGIDGAPLTLTKLTGNTTQKTVSGKNLYKVNNTSGSTSGGITWVITDDTITLSGTASGTSSNGPYFTLPTPLDAGTYRLTLPQTLPYKISIQMLEPDSTQHSGFAVINAGSTTSKGTTTWSTAKMRVSFSGWTANDNISFSFPNKLMFSAGEDNVPYEEYVGGVPSPNPSYPQAVNNVTGLQTVEVMGKNLLKVPAGTLTSSGLTWTVTDDTITISGQASNTASNYSYFTLPRPLSAGTYTFSIPEALSNVIRIGVMEPDGTTHSTWSISVGYQKASTTVNYEMAKLRIGLSSIVVGTTYNITLPNRLQFEEGSTATDYEPYQAAGHNIVLGAPSVWDFTTESYDTNASNIENVTTDSLTLADTGASGTQYARYVITGLDASKTYSLSGIGKKLAKSTGGDHRTAVSWAGSNDGSTWSALINIFSLTYDVGVEMPFNTVLTGYSQYRLTFFNNSSSTATGEKTQFYDVKLQENTIELAKIDYCQDYIYKSEGKWYKHAEIGKVTYNGTQTWSQTTNTMAFYRTKSDVMLAGNDDVVPVRCDYYTPNTYRSVATQGSVDYGIALHATTPRITIRNKDCADHTAFETWLTSHNITVYYPLATPTDTEITDAGLLAELNAIASLYDGINSLMLIPSAEPQGEMDVEYPTVKDIDYHEVVIDCQARTVTQDGVNLYPALAEGSEFIRLLPGENKLYLASAVPSDDGTAEVKFKKGNISI